MRALLLFTLACSSTPVAPITPPRQHPPRALPAPDAAPTPPPGARGEACSVKHECAEPMMCGPLPGGYCTSSCGVVGAPCDGACMETGRAGELCMKPCTGDADCRADEGYVCDPVWHACALPNMAAIVPKQCPGDGKRDAAFGDAQELGALHAYDFEPSSALAADGSLVTFFIARDGIFAGNPLGATSAAGTKEFTTKKTTHFDPWLARDAKGTLYAVWYGFNGRDQDGEIAMASSSDRGATWSEPAVVHDPADCRPEDFGCLDKPMIAIGPMPMRLKGEALYVMYSAAGGGLRVRASHDGGKTFGKTATALAGIYGNAVVGNDGRLHVVTLNGGPMGAFGSAQQKVEYTVSADGGATFAKALTVSARDEVIPFFFSNPSLAVDDRRKWLYIAYARGGRDAKWDIVLAATKDGGKTWVRATLGDGCAIHMVPNLALDPTTGTLHVAYYDSQGAPGRFVHATCGVGLVKCTVAGAINSQPFAALSTERHGAKWVGEYETLLVDDKRRVLHAAWSQPVAEGDKVVARIFHATAKLPVR